MSGVSPRTGGGVVAIAGVVLTAYHLHVAALFLDGPLVTVVEFVPAVLSVVVVAVGVTMARDGLVERQFVGRTLTWAAVGTVVLSLFGLLGLLNMRLKGVPVRNIFGPTLNFATFGALVGLVVGIYDVRGLKQQQSVEQLNRINDTLRIATQELVNNRDRGELEQTICERLTDSDLYDTAWVGRYDAEERVVTPRAWAGMPDEYFETLVVTVDDSPTGGGAGGRAIKTREIQSVPDVFEDPTMEPWWETLERHGVESLSVVPLTHGETVYGLVSIYANRHNVFDEREREALAELGETVGHAIAAIETHERLAERERELARQNERLDEFASVVSHDLRNPLNVAEGYLDLARAEGEDDHFDRIEAALARMSELIDDVLTLARQGTTVDEFQRVPLGDVVDEAWTTIDADGATLRTDDELGAVLCDRSRLRQLVENLFRNAVEHGSTGSETSSDDAVEHGSGNVTVTVHRTEGGFAVEDDGPGIPPAVRGSVFEAGYSTNEDGTGFGLNIVRTVADAHGWEVTIGESATGGARFEFVGVGVVEADAATV